MSLLSLRISIVIVLVSIGACEKRKGSLMPPRHAAAKVEPVSEAPELPSPPVRQEMRAKSIPNSAGEGPDGPDEGLTPMSDADTLDLQKVKQEALARIKNHPSDQLADGSSARGKAAALFHRGRQLIVKGDFEEGQEYYLAACQLGFTEGCHKFGWLEQRQGNLANARQFYKIACEGGLSKSCNNLGFQLEKQQHWDEALDFYARACLAKHSTGCENLKRLRNDQLRIR